MNARRLRLFSPIVLVLASIIVIGYRNLMATEVVDRVSYFPAETDQVLNNPYMGFVIDARNKEAKQPFRLAYANLTWADLEPEKGKYAFDAVERKFQFAFWKTKGVSLILRVVLDYPTEVEHLDIPNWLYEETSKKGVSYNLAYGKGFSPDYNNPRLIENHERLIQALGERYNNDPQVAFIELGSIGHWGEWHTMDEGSQRIEFPKEDVTDNYVNHYLRYFDRKLLLMRRPHEIALSHHLGLFNDAFGSHESTIDGFLKWYTDGYKSWLTQNDQPAMPYFWKSAPSGGEFRPDVTYLNDSNMEETLLQSKLTHVSWLGPSAPSQEPYGGRLQPNIDRFLKTIGYRFVIAKESHEKKVRTGNSLHVKLNIINRGVAPFYFAWPLELSLSNEQGIIVSRIQTNLDIREWLPGAQEVSHVLPIPANLAHGIYIVNAAILNPETNKPEVDFAIDGRSSDGHYSLGTVEILRK
ncbi:DUF4832 domain-containing protein [Paenibacillus roseipurpureus]|uniref:DUF4832 domain-containing protein n=1 Tax=Paenibacillus roseopurpureus TaxID=2918901 RepID=A0AA96LJT7_9BACL|nr:DUF4832 domain-containing protein [Paenibacillus sp. MBLB1832]WNR42346.1 DUF4832 domain-containing protein [Paenibacillus sp. MBLB1832]